MSNTNQKLLIVEDDKDLASVLQELLASVCPHISLATDGQNALQLIKETEFDCVLSDIKMPKMDGVELIKEVRQRGHHMPFIFYTAHGNRELLLEVVKYGVFDFLTKPNVDSVEESVARALQENKKNKNNDILKHEDLGKLLDGLKQK